VKVSEAIEEYMASKKRLKPKTRAGYGYALTLFSTWCDEHNIKLDGLKAKTVEEFIQYLPAAIHPKKRGVETSSTYTAALYTTIVKAFLHWCALDEDFEQFVEIRTVEKIEKPKKDQLVTTVFTTEQLQKMLAACEQEITPELVQRNKAIVLLLSDTGIRSEELTGLCLDQIDLSPLDEKKGKQPHIRVFGKNSKWREVGLGERCRKELWRYVTRFRAPDRDKHVPIFLSRTGEPLTYSGLHKNVKIIGERAGIKGVRPHLFRHFYAVSYMRQPGSDIFKLSRLMGHSTIRTTDEYMRGFTRGDARRGSVSVIDMALSGK